MTKVTIRDKKIRIDDEPISLISGEVHYWRLDPANWRPVLRRVKEMGLRIVATYVCWDFHEIEPGRFDFSGKTDPRRDLSGFLDLLGSEGFYIILRPGPYIYSEWRNGGVPDYAAGFHRLSPEFQRAALPYLRAVTEAALPHLATHGGRIILWQADNEIDPWPHLFTEQIGLGNAPGPFQEFLRQEYTHIEALNRAWGANYPAFEEARAISALIPDRPDLLPPYLDYARFQHWYVNRVATWAVGVFRELGVDVPIYLNTYSGVSTQNWPEMESLADLAGPDIYPSREFDRRPNEHRNFLDAVRYTRAYSRLPYIPEFQAGIWHDWLAEVGGLPENHYRLVCLSALLAGAAGWNWYMLVNRDNWYQSPINERGLTRTDLFEVFRQMASLFEEVDPPTLVKLASTAVTYDPLQRATVRPGQELLQALHVADIDYEFFDLSRSQPGHGPAGDARPLLLYAGGVWLSAAGQERLNEYMHAGGHLVYIGCYPRYDDRLQPLNATGVEAPQAVIGRSPRVRLEAFGGLTVNSPWMYSYTKHAGDPIVAERLPSPNILSEELQLQNNLQTGERYTIGYTMPRGRGRLTVLGLAPSPGLLIAVHQYFNLSIPSRASTSGISTALFRRAGEWYLVAANHSDQDKAALVHLNTGMEDGGRPGAREWRAKDLLRGVEWTIHIPGNPLALSIPRKDGAIVRLTPVNS